MEPFIYNHTRQFGVDSMLEMLKIHDIAAINFETSDEQNESFGIVVATVSWPSAKPANGVQEAPTPTWIIHEDGSSIEDFIEVVNVLLSESSATKLVHGLHAIVHRLAINGLDVSGLKNVMDLQLYYEVHVDRRARNATVLELASRCGVNVTSSKEALSCRVEKSDLLKHLLPHNAIQAMAKTARTMLTCYKEGLCKRTTPAERSALCEMTARRWIYASQCNGNAVFWFDMSADFAPRSLECLGSEEEVGNVVPLLQLQGEIEPLLQLLPDKFRDAIRAVKDADQTLADVILDLGRIPHGCMGYRQRIELQNTRQCSPVPIFDSSDLALILERLGGEDRIGTDNRAGIDKQLHRISVMRDKTGRIYGLTMRVGRSLQYASNYLLDLLMSSEHRKKSVLLLGRPGSGKTTLIRDIARCISESGENVCIIDTSNEIGGDGLVPHECIGWARRMMVKSLNDQARVMIECVQNHTVETLVIDEIGRKAEVNAAGTVRQRGPRIIASAHGDFRSLIKNQDLKGLVGGVQSVTVGDKEAKKSAFSSKLQSKRAGNPIFDVIVEIDEVHRGRCRIIWDVGRAVDSALGGDDFDYETRFQTSKIRGVQSLK